MSVEYEAVVAAVTAAGDNAEILGSLTCRTTPSRGILPSRWVGSARLQETGVRAGSHAPVQ